MNKTNFKRISKIKALSETHEAALEFIALRDRKANPYGKFDKAGRFHIAESDVCPCCQSIRSPSRAFPYSEMIHARSALHVSAQHGVEAADLRYVSKLIDEYPELEDPAILHAAIAANAVGIVTEKARRERGFKRLVAFITPDSAWNGEYISPSRPSCSFT